jgi:pSer/pThr/pTyr-binding forkhead associated (FHA) protein
VRGLPVALRTVSPAELAERLQAERRGIAFVLYVDGARTQRIVDLSARSEPLCIGRDVSNDIPLHWDDGVSRVHALLEPVGGEWTLVDDGLSRNGSFVNGERVVGRRRLGEGDALRFGDTTVVFRAPVSSDSAREMTAIGMALPAPGAISEAQRRVLVALCRPVVAPGGLGTPATNQQIADELFLSVDAVKTHLRALFGKFGIEDLPQNQKRTRLVSLALAGGAVSEHELQPT